MTRMINQPIVPTTRANYEEMLRQLWQFCAIMGDYESMLIMISPMPKHVPAMKVEMIEAFLCFK